MQRAMTPTVRRLLLVACLLGAMPRPSGACSIACRIPDERGAAFREARVVFAGRVVARQETISESSFGEVRTDVVAEVAVETRWKGPARDVVVVHSATSTLCGGGEPLDLGAAYLVWAHDGQDASDELLEAGFCTRTQPLEHAAADLAFLDAATATADRGCQVGPPPSGGAWAVLVSLPLLAPRLRRTAPALRRPRSRSRHPLSLALSR